MQGLRAAEGVVLALGRASVGVGGAKDATNGNPETKNGTTRQQRQNNPCATDLFSGCPTAGSMASVARSGWGGGTERNERSASCRRHLRVRDDQWGSTAREEWLRERRFRPTTGVCSVCAASGGQFSKRRSKRARSPPRDSTAKARCLCEDIAEVERYVNIGEGDLRSHAHMATVHGTACGSGAGGRPRPRRRRRVRIAAHFRRPEALSSRQGSRLCESETVQTTCCPLLGTLSIRPHS